VLPKFGNSHQQISIYLTCSKSDVFIPIKEHLDLPVTSIYLSIILVLAGTWKKTRAMCLALSHLSAPTT